MRGRNLLLIAAVVVSLLITSSFVLLHTIDRNLNGFPAAPTRLNNNGSPGPTVSNWQTYHDGQFDFEISYPPDFVLSSTSNSELGPGIGG
jgi:hypothetical protein